MSILKRAKQHAKAAGPTPFATTSNMKSQHDPALQGERVAAKTIVYGTLLVVSFVLPVAGLVPWLAIVGQSPGQLLTFAGSPIGGHLTQPEAKAIDILCSSFLGPTIMAALNYVWFAAARVCVVTEERHRGRDVPLESLATASIVNSGRYDPLTFHSLLRGRTWRLWMLAVTALCSAVASSCFSNMIAYEAFSEYRAEQGPSYTLRALQDNALNDTRNIITDAGNSLDGLIEDFGFMEGANWTYQMTMMLNQVAKINTSQQLSSSGAYVQIDATNASLNAVDSNVDALQDVRGFSISATCTPAWFVDSSNSGWTEDSSSTFFAYGSLNTSADPTPKSYQFLATFDFLEPSIMLGFSNTEPSVVLAFAIWQPGNVERPTVDSPYGTVEATSITGIYGGQGLSNAPNFDYAWAVQCEISQQFGAVDIARSDEDWTMLSDMRPNGGPDGVWSFLWSGLSTNMSANSSDMYTFTHNGLSSYQAPGVNATGRGPAAVLAGHMQGMNNSETDCTAAGGTLIPQITGGGNDSVEWTRPAMCVNLGYIVDSFVYATGEAKRITYNIVASNESHNSTAYYYHVTGTGTAAVPFYRITYVPLLLLGGLLSTLGAAASAGALVVRSWRTLSWRMFRQVDVLRLLVDSIAGLRAGQIAQLRSQSDDAIANWARRVYVRYERTDRGEDEDKGGTIITLNEVPYPNLKRLIESSRI